MLNYILLHKAKFEIVITHHTDTLFMIVRRGCKANFDPTSYMIRSDRLIGILISKVCILICIFSNKKTAIYIAPTFVASGQKVTSVRDR